VGTGLPVQILAIRWSIHCNLFFNCTEATSPWPKFQKCFFLILSNVNLVLSELDFLFTDNSLSSMLYSFQLSYWFVRLTHTSWTPTWKKHNWRVITTNS